MDMHVFISQTIMNIDGMIWTFMQRIFVNTYEYFIFAYTHQNWLFCKFACKNVLLVLLHLCQCFGEVTTPKLEHVESLV